MDVREHGPIRHGRFVERAIFTEFGFRTFSSSLDSATDTGAV
jgi:hypothetical protein